MIRIGVVGCGRILAAHLRGYRLLREAGFEDFRITALCARNEADAWSYIARGKGPPQRRPVSTLAGDPLAIGDEYLSDFQSTEGVRVFTDFRDMIANGGIDAVNDYTAHGLHHVVAAEAFAKNKHVLSQKPLAVTVEGARRMCEQATAAGVTFGVFENARHRPWLRRTRWAFERDPQQVRPRGAGFPQMALLGNVGTWWAPNLVVGQTPWRHEKILGGGLTLDLSVHQFHMIRQVFGEIDSIEGRTRVVEPRRHILDGDGNIISTIDCDADDTFYASFSCRNGASGTLFASFAGHGTKTVLEGGAVFYGSRGRVSGDEIHLDGSPAGQSLTELYERTATPGEKAADFPHGIEDHFAVTQHHWLEAVRHGTQPSLDGREGLIDLACAYAILESDLAGHRVDVDDVLSGRTCEYQKPINAHFNLS